MENQNDFINIDGNKIVYRGTGYEDVSTSQPIPANLRSFIFKTKIVKSSKDVRICLGYEFDGGYIRWSNDRGFLDNHEKIITNLESYAENDDIYCYLRRIPIKQKDYQYFKWIKNGKVIGSWLMEGENVHPFIRFEALHDSVQTVQLETNFDISSPSSTSGKFLMS